MKKHVRTLSSTEILELIFVYLTEVSSTRDYDDIIDILANMGRALTSADRCSVWIVNEDRTKIWTKVAHGIEAIEIDIDSGIVGASITSGEKFIIDDVYKDKRFNKEIDQRTGYITKSMMVIPMFDNDDVIIGAFQVINHLGEKDVFDENDMQRLMLASTYAAETLISAKLTQEIQDTQKEVVFTMGAIGESRSKETGNHVRRVAKYSKILALAYGFDEEEAELLKQASPMHDIGKVAIPDSILNKPGRFDAYEREIMETHAELGYGMIKNSERPLLKAAAIVAHEHHEKWDGSGYPRKLAGEDIHIYGRITALADVFDALASDRVYKKAWSDERIFKLLREEQGKHFDPKLVDLFFEHLDEILAVREKFKDVYKEPKKDIYPYTVKVLGAYGTRAKGFGTTSIYLNDNNVIDAGNLINTLGEDCAMLGHIWLTHSHLDHIADIAPVLDSYFRLREKPLHIHALPQTIEALKKHLLNDYIWPDFSKIAFSGSDEKYVKYIPIKFEKEYALSNNESIYAFPTDHTVPSCGYIYKKDNNAILITADTYDLENIIDLLEKRKDIKTMVIECSFPSNMENLAKESKHLTPKLLFKQLENLKRDDITLYINHLKPMYITTIMKEVAEFQGALEAKIVKDEEILTF